MNSLLKSVEQFFIPCDQASWYGPRRCHAVLQALSTKSAKTKAPPFETEGRGIPIEVPNLS